MRMVWVRLTMRLRALAPTTRAALGPALMWVSVSCSGEGSSKKAAELVAAESAYARLLAEKGDAGLALPGVNEALAADQAHGSLLGGVPANATDD